MKIKRRISPRAFKQFKRMCFVMAVMFASNFMSANYISNEVNTFMDSEYSQYSGLFVQADGLGYEGERIS